jgi:hypothetical protein
MQIGAIWLPFPHLLNAVPVQADVLYRTGLSAVAFSVIGFVLGAVALWAIVARGTGSAVAAWTAFVVFAAHPDVLYLQATPMTESLLMGLCLVGILLTWRWVVDQGARRHWAPGLALALACLTRYEAWPVTAAALTLAFGAIVRAGLPLSAALARVAGVGLYPAMAVVGFMVLSRLTVGHWLVTGGFYETDPSLYHQPTAVAAAVWLGVRRLNGDVITAIGAAGLLVLLGAVYRNRARSHLIVALALAACVAVPFYAFWSGHPIKDPVHGAVDNGARRVRRAGRGASAAAVACAFSGDCDRRRPPGNAAARKRFSDGDRGAA